MDNELFDFCHSLVINIFNRCTRERTCQHTDIQHAHRLRRKDYKIFTSKDRCGLWFMVYLYMVYLVVFFCRKFYIVFLFLHVVGCCQAVFVLHASHSTLNLEFVQYFVKHYHTCTTLSVSLSIVLVMFSVVIVSFTCLWSRCEFNVSTM